MAIDNPRIRDRSIKLYGGESDFSLAALVIPGLCLGLFLAGITVLSTIYFRHRIEVLARSFLAVPPSGAFTHQALRASLIWDYFEIRGIQYFPADSQEPIRIGRLIISDLGRKSLFKMARQGLEIPDSFTVGIVDMLIPANQFSPQTERALEDLGFDSLNISLSGAVSMDRRTNQMDLTRFVVDVNDAGRILFSASLNNLSLPRDINSIAQVFTWSQVIESQEWQKALIASLDVEFRNNTMLERLGARASIRHEKGPFAWLGINSRTTASSSIDFMTMTAKKLREVAAGRSFRVRAEPQPPVAIEEISMSLFSNLNSAQKKLGLSHL
jgi:hypothetical protein